MAKTRRFQNSFQTGEVNEDFLRRADTELIQGACKTARNVILNPGGGFERRPGSNVVASIGAGSYRLFRFEGDGFVEELIARHNSLLVYGSDGVLKQTISSLNWAVEDLPSMQIAADENQAFFVGQNFKPMIATRDSSGSWSVADVSFASGFGSDVNAPFYRFADAGITMSLGGTYGTVSITFSDDVLDASHVGVRFRYLLANQIRIASVSTARTGTAEILDTLYVSYDLTITLGEADRFKVGHVIVGDTSGVRARVVSISGTTMTAVMLEGYEPFDTTGGTIEKIVGPEGTCTPSAVSASSAGPAATTIWDEELISSVRGFPGTVAVHRNRLYFGRIPQAPSLLCASVSGQLTDFSTGAEASDAIIEKLGDDPNAEIRHIVSAEQLVLLTDRGAYYVPESGENPITPTSITFLKIGPEGASNVDPVVSSEGVLFVDDSSSRLMALVPTGNVRRSWQIIELSENASHLLTGPVRLAVANGLDGRPERYVFVLNEDYTIAVAMYRRNTDAIGWVCWEHGGGRWSDLAAVKDSVHVIARSGLGVWISEFKFTALVDDEAPFLTTSTDRPSLTSQIVEEMVVTATATADSLGFITTVTPSSEKTIGSDFRVECTPAPPTISQVGHRRMRIPRYWLEVLNSGSVRVGGRLFSPYQGGDDLSEIGRTRTRIVSGFTLGWSDEPTLPVTQEIGEGAKLDVRALTYEVAY